MTTFGKIQEFSPETERFSAYLERVELFFAANDVPAEKKVPVFLSVVGGATYGVLRNLLAPANPKDKTFEEITTALQAHFEPKTLVIAERFHFHRRNQAPEESVNDYVAELRRLATNCAFGAYLEEALRDRLVCGLRNESVQKRLLAEADLTLARAVQIAQGMEAAHKNAQSFKGRDLPVGRVERQPRIRGQRGRSSDSGFISTDKQGNSAAAGKPCHRCGKTGHGQHECGFKHATCYKCGKMGHLARVCRSAKDKGSSNGKAKWVETQSQETSEESEEEVIYRVGAKPSQPYQVVIEINGAAVKMEVDTGAAVTIMSQKTQEALFPSAALCKPTVNLRTYTSEPIVVLGQMTVDVKYERYVGTRTLFVVKGSGPCLLGRDWLRDIRLDWASIKSVNVQDNLSQLLKKYKELFQPELGTMKLFRAQPHPEGGCETKVLQTTFGTLCYKRNSST